MNRVTRKTHSNAASRVASRAASRVATKANSVAKSKANATKAKRTKAKLNAVTKKRLELVPETAKPLSVMDTNNVWKNHMGFKPEGNVVDLETKDNERVKTINCQDTFALDAIDVRYRPDGYSVKLEGTHSPREVLLVLFREPINLFKFCDTDGRVFLRPSIPFYRTTASSTTSVVKELKNTWFPTFGVTPTYHLVKVSSLVTKKGFTLSWQPFLDMYVNLQLKLDRKADQKQNPYTAAFDMNGDTQLLMKELAARTCSWDFLRISAKIGGGIWSIQEKFCTFVKSNAFVNMHFVPDETFLEGFLKSPVFKTTQIYPGEYGAVDQPETEIPLMLCRLEPVFTTSERKEGVMVTYNP